MGQTPSILTEDSDTLVLRRNYGPGSRFTIVSDKNGPINSNSFIYITNESGTSVLSYDDQGRTIWVKNTPSTVKNNFNIIKLKGNPGFTVTSGDTVIIRGGPTANIDNPLAMQLLSGRTPDRLSIFDTNGFDETKLSKPNAKICWNAYNGEAWLISKAYSPRLGDTINSGDTITLSLVDLRDEKCIEEPKYSFEDYMYGINVPAVTNPYNTKQLLNSEGDRCYENNDEILQLITSITLSATATAIRGIHVIDVTNKSFDGTETMQIIKMPIPLESIINFKWEAPSGHYLVAVKMFYAVDNGDSYVKAIKFGSVAGASRPKFKEADVTWSSVFVPQTYNETTDPSFTAFMPNMFIKNFGYKTDNIGFRGLFNTLYYNPFNAIQLIKDDSANICCSQNLSGNKLVTR
jgi:hypothetical protein